jgi:hypothetical protein
MNVENAFIKSGNREAVLAFVTARLNAPPDGPGKQPKWALTSSYDMTIASDPKRKIAVSCVVGGWIAVVESRGAVDFALLQTLSESLETDVVTCQFYDTAGAYAYARCVSGRIAEAKSLDDVSDPLKAMRDYLGQLAVPFDLFTFAEAIRLREDGWVIMRRPRT